MRTIRDHSLYLVISEEYAMGRSVLEVARCAITGGVNIIQMREKKKSMQELVKMGGELSKLCKDKGITFIVNDDPMLAKRVDADGVHLGQEDMARFPIRAAREILGRGRFIGVSTSSLKEVEKAHGEDIDYIAYGPVFQTKVKEHPVGTAQIKGIIAIAKKPVFFIGGIDLCNVDEILQLGGKNIAVIRAITESADIAGSTSKIKEKLTAGRAGD